MKYIVLAALVVCGGCTTTYYHPTKSEADYQQDMYECETIANQRAADRGLAGNVFAVDDEKKRCMTVKYGYST